MPRVATIILNRNLPDVTDSLVDRFRKHDTGTNDVYVVESGSQQDRLSRHYTSWANWDEALLSGLRFPRGFNFGLLDLLRKGRFWDYDYFLLTRNSIEFDGPMVSVLTAEMEQHPQACIVSPCGETWDERDVVGVDGTAYVWHVNHLIWLVRRSFVEAVMERVEPSHMNLFYDGTNFRGHYADTELITKGYVNGFATALTTKVLFREKSDLLKRFSDLMKTEPYGVNEQLIFDEGREWMRRKYGFTTRLHMQEYAGLFYDRFFQLNPHLSHLRLAAY
jgi:hypothetical protein